MLVRGEMRVDQTSIGVVEESAFNLEIKITDFANRVDLGTERQAGVGRVLAWAAAGLHLIFPKMGRDGDKQAVGGEGKEQV